MNTAPFRVEQRDGSRVGTLFLESAGRPVVVIDHELLRRLEATLSTLPQGLSGLVIASDSPRAFVAGADLKAIQALDDGSLDRYLAYGSRVFGMIASLPMTTVAAINGAALGGGLELAMHCDLLIGTPGAGGRPYPVGLPEAGLEICPGWGGTNLLPARIDPELGITLTATGRTLNYDEAAEAGLFDRVCDRAEDLLDEAAALAGAGGSKPSRSGSDGVPSCWIGASDYAESVLGALSRVRPDLPGSRAAGAVADAVERGLSDGWGAALAAERGHLVRLRSTPEARRAIEAFFAKSAAKK